ncbi:hypothetical protein [Corynebacterium cystitidis]|uniref:hypothetical protein n=1 Tax=Corynebacterium cystitidis TaxID=35757 RepID=UPI00211E33D7|nr:hypothetical protein [Corynebacterium cystitidis]
MSKRLEEKTYHQWLGDIAGTVTETVAAYWEGYGVFEPELVEVHANSITARIIDVIHDQTHQLSVAQLLENLQEAVGDELREAVAACDEGAGQ